MNTKEGLLEKLIVMPDVNYIQKTSNEINIELSTPFQNSNAQRFIDVLKGYQWHLDNQHSTYIKIRLI